MSAKNADKRPLSVIDNVAEHRYEIHTEGQVAILVYKRGVNRISLLHTEVPPALEGRGIAGMLARAALEAARADGLEVVPICPYVVAYLRRHQEYLSLVSPANREHVLAGK